MILLRSHINWEVLRGVEIIGNDDATGLDYSMDQEEAAEREQEIRTAIAEIQREEAQVAVRDSDRDDELSSYPFVCCGTSLAGPRHHCMILGSGRER
ncbi:hypothetical protein [Halomonas sp. BC04]|uniref:hypothetical protein n=1 Tax=Halomonas sp. BC04 TaxID=1403540 RepID=UPI0003ED7453|nr:hypothetical protein [Halomonas sp. BC04]EWH01947.1 hypothetical protein Q427_11545 [Halomonas sp. BC04]